jgi:hypothetical protein
MKRQRSTLTGILVAALAGSSLLRGQTPPLPLEPPHEAGTSVTAVYEGWFPNPDGTYSLLVGYLNRNEKQEIDIPIGPNNRIEPGGPDRGQPTHFLTGRQWGMFAIKVPKDFGTNKLTWTIVANNKPTSVPVWLNKDYEISPFIEAAVGNTPPTLKFEESGSTVQGPQGMNIQRTATVGAPLELNTWVADDAKWTSNSGARPRNQSPIPVIVTWTKYRGPGSVTFEKVKPEVQKLESSDAKFPFHGKATTTAKFSEPGDYVLHVTINDYSGEGGGGGFQCCWTNGTVNVSVKP